LESKDFRRKIYRFKTVTIRGYKIIPAKGIVANIRYDSHRWNMGFKGVHIKDLVCTDFSVNWDVEIVEFGLNEFLKMGKSWVTGLHMGIALCLCRGDTKLV